MGLQTWTPKALGADIALVWIFITLHAFSPTNTLWITIIFILLGIGALIGGYVLIKYVLNGDDAEDEIEYHK